MGISNQNQGLRSGVCTSTTRPTSPYAGMVIYETDTNLSYTYNGSSWQQVSGGTSVGNSGLVYITTQSLGTGSSASVNNCFSSLYDNYLITVGGMNCSAGARIYMRMRVGGTDTTTGYYYSTLSVPYSTTAPANFGAGNASFFYTDIVGDTTQTAGGVINLFSPFLTTETSFMEQGVDTRTGGTSGTVQGFLNDNVSYTGFTMLLSGQTFSAGIVTVFGYRK